MLPASAGARAPGTAVSRVILGGDLTQVHSDHAARARAEAAAYIRLHPDDAELVDGRAHYRNERPAAEAGRLESTDSIKGPRWPDRAKDRLLGHYSGPFASGGVHPLAEPCDRTLGLAWLGIQIGRSRMVPTAPRLTAGRRNAVSGRSITLATGTAAVRPRACTVG